MERFVLNDPLGGSKVKNIEGFIDNNRCFICDSHSKFSSGRYYQITRVVKGRKRTLLLHRYVYESYFNEIPQGIIVRHKCDNDLCINPDHLELGTIQDNSNDMVKRGRSTKGEKNRNSKLSKYQVEEIKLLLQTTNLTQQKIADMFGVSQRNISYIKNNELWN